MSVVCIVLAVLMILSVLISALGSVYAVTQSEINALKNKRDSLNNEMEYIQSRIRDLESQKSSVLELKAALDAKLELNQKDIDLTQQEIDYYTGLIAEQEIAIDEAQQKVDEQYERYCTRVRSMEENGITSYFSVLFHANSFSEFLTNLDYIYEIMKHDKEVEQLYIEAKEALELIKEEYEAARSELDIKKEDLVAKQTALQQETEAAYTMILELENDIDAYKAAYEENEAEEDRLQQEINEAVKELEEQQDNNNNQYYVGNGTYVWPCPASRNVTSPFGYRVHPIFGTTKFHSGIDIAAASGSAVIATASGTVVTSTYSSSYGNYIVINHGNGMTSLYAHLSSRLVSVGASVAQGTTIGLVGSTGWSTGPHLHFEISQNGTRVNPRNYVG